MSHDSQLLITAAYSDTATRSTIRDYLLPKVIKERDDLVRIRKGLTDDQLDMWVEAGLVDDELAMSNAIAFAESALAA